MATKKPTPNAEARRTNVLLEAIQSDIKVFMEDQRGLRTEFNAFRAEFNALKAEFTAFRIEVSARLSKLEAEFETFKMALHDTAASVKRIDERLTTVESRPS